MEESIAKQEIVTELLVKFAKAVIPVEKNPLKQKKLNMEILGIGNAIVDVICKVGDNYLKENGLEKSTQQKIEKS